MGSSGTDTHNTAAPPARDESGHAAAEMYSIGMAELRPMLKWLGGVGSVAVLICAWFAADSPLFDGVDVALFGGSFVAFAVYEVLIFVVADRQLYRVVLAWVVTTAVLFASLLINAMFGSLSDRILDEQLPLYLAAVPVPIIYAHTYLVPRHALQISGGYVLGLALAAVGLTLLHWNTGPDRAGLVFLLLTTLVVNPVVLGFMWVNNRLQRRAHELYLRSAASLRRMRKYVEREQMIDPQTSLPNRDGIGFRIEELLGSQDRMLLVAFGPDGDALPFADLPPQELERRLRSIASRIAEGLGPEFELGRLGDLGFLAWSAAPQSPGLIGRVEAIIDALTESAAARSTGLSFSAGVICASGGDAGFALEDAAFHLFLAQSRGGRQVCCGPAVRLDGD